MIRGKIWADMARCTGRRGTPRLYRGMAWIGDKAGWKQSFFLPKFLFMA